MGGQRRAAGLALAGVAEFPVTYATEEDMRIRFGEELLEQLSPPGEAGDAAATLAVAYAAARYRVPLEPVPAPVRRWCADIARWFLDQARTDEAIRKAYEDAIAGLKDMARGVIVFQCRGIASEDTPNGQVAMSGPKRMFSMESLKGY